MQHGSDAAGACESATWRCRLQAVTSGALQRLFGDATRMAFHDANWTDSPALRSDSGAYEVAYGDLKPLATQSNNNDANCRVRTFGVTTIANFYKNRAGGQVVWTACAKPAWNPNRKGRPQNAGCVSNAVIAGTNV